MRKHMWIGYLFAAVCLYFAFRGISFAQFGQTLAQAKPSWILLTFLIYLIDFLLRSGRWAILIKPIQALSAVELFWPMMIGFFANNVLPLRMGEVVRAHVCGNKFKISRTAALGSILIERIADTIGFLSTFLVASLFIPFPNYMEKGAWLLGLGSVTAIAVLIFIRRYETGFHALLDWSPLPPLWNSRIKHLASSFIQSTTGLTQASYVIKTLILSLIIWIIEGTVLYFMAHAFSIPMKYAEAFFLLLALGLSVTLPQAPGAVGTFEFFGVTALALLGISKSRGLPLILAIHGFQFIFISVFGLYGLWREGLSFRNLTSLDKT